MKTAVAGTLNAQVRLRTRPVGIPQASDFELVRVPLRAAEDGEVLLQVLYLSIVPAMRGWASAEGNYADPVAVGDVMKCAGIARVAGSRHPSYSEGDLVLGMFGWQEWTTVSGASGGPIERRLDPALFQDLPPTAALGVLGLAGLTAYFGLKEVCVPHAGETVVVSSAAGSVGSCAGQIARIAGCRTVGIAGGSQKLAVCREEFGFDATVDHRAPDLAERLREACPQGVDVYFDNTSGPISDAVLAELNVGARVVVCGTVAVGSWSPIPQGPRVERHLLVKRARMQGMLVYDFRPRFDQALVQLAGWIRDGRLRFKEDFMQGIESVPGSIAALYEGRNLGKLMIRLHA